MVAYTAVSLHTLYIFVCVSQEVIRSWAADLLKQDRGFISHSSSHHQTGNGSSPLPPTSGWKHIFTPSLSNILNARTVVMGNGIDKYSLRSKLLTWLYLKLTKQNFESSSATISYCLCVMFWWIARIFLLTNLHFSMILYLRDTIRTVSLENGPFWENNVFSTSAVTQNDLKTKP